MIKSSLMVAEMYQLLDKSQEAANTFVRIANVSSNRTVLKPLLYEQASYEYLMLQQFRKAAFYMSLAGQGYERLGLKYHSFNCFQLIHPFYQQSHGWSSIRFKLYSSLSENCKDAKGNSKMAVQFFRNLLELSHEFTDMN
jgi:hypothetical protein